VTLTAAGDTVTLAGPAGTVELTAEDAAGIRVEPA
jgi:hypothetical protein